MKGRGLSLQDPLVTPMARISHTIRTRISIRFRTPFFLNARHDAAFL